ncbi:MAG: hypothetical protein JWN70_302 [Planctomycetaceae bacterium]|nr:hypothetical protein [Planctomycetaceae bacterium]
MKHGLGHPMRVVNGENNSMNEDVRTPDIPARTLS